MDLLHRPLGIRAPDPLKFCFAYAKYRPEDDSQVTFSCDGPRGALLSLPVSAQSEDTVALDKFGKWMTTHINAWFAFTQSLGMGVEKMEDIILVTGRHLTKSWINVAFNQGRRDAGVSFNAYVSRNSEINLERQYVHGGDLKLGPTGKVLLLHIFKPQQDLRHPGHGIRPRIYAKINAYSFEGSVSLASWGSGQGFGDRRDLIRVQVGTNLNPNPTFNLNT
jgi:hypothetical protein